MLISKNIRDIIILVVILLLIFLLRGWLKDKIITSLGGYTDKETTIVVDTQYIKGKVDTLAVFNHYVETRGIILNPKPRVVTKWIPSTEVDGAKTSVEYKEFNVNIVDSLLTGTITLLNDFSGNLTQLDFKYKPLFPKYITRVDTIKVTNTVTETLTNVRSKLGVGVGYNNLNHASLLGSYTTKKGWQFIGEYGKSLAIPENIRLNDVRTFTVPNKDLISFKIIKNF